MHIRDEDYISAARDIHEVHGYVEVDDSEDVIVSRAEDESGAYVAAWVWVSWDDALNFKEVMEWEDNDA
jgi:hypothetical protein